MAIYHASVKPISRSAGRSATAASAYRSATKVRDYATGELFDYTRKRGVEHAEIVLSTDAAKADINWARNRQELWNTAEAAEKRKDARIAREYELALPSELNKQQRLALTRAFAGEIANRYQVAVDFAIHKPHRSGDQRNFHAHLISTTREVTPTGLGPKTDIELGDKDRARKGLGRGADEIKYVRSRWADITNEHLKELGLDARIDHRSLKDQGVDREPTVHLGPAVTEMHRRGMRTEVLERISEQQRLDLQARLERAAEAGRLEREAQEVNRSILDLSGDIAAARAERGRAQGSQPTLQRKLGLSPMADIEARQQAAAERWKARQLEPKPAAPDRSRTLDLGNSREKERTRGPELPSNGLEDDFDF